MTETNYPPLGDDIGEAGESSEREDFGHFEQNAATAKVMAAFRTEGESDPNLTAPDSSESASDSTEAGVSDQGEAAATGQEEASAANSGVEEETSPEIIDPALTREALQFVFAVFNGFEGLGIDPTQSEYKSMIDRIVTEVNKHPEIADDTKRKEELFKLMAVGLWRDLIQEIGLGGTVDAQEEPGAVIKRIQEGIWQQQLASDELKGLTQADNSDTVADRLLRLVQGTATIKGEPLPQLGSPEGQASWQAISQAHEQRKAQGANITKKAGERLLLLTMIGDELNHLDDPSKRANVHGAVTQSQQQWIETYIADKVVGQTESASGAAAPAAETASAAPAT